jgi:cyclopropane-fatty-acyl-phospholipid synthase
MTSKDPNSTGLSSTPASYADSVHPTGAGPSLGLEQALLGRMLRALSTPSIGFVLWDGEQLVSSPNDAIDSWIEVRDRVALWRLLSYPDYYFPEMYAQGRIRVEGDLVQTLDRVQRARREFDFDTPARRLLAALFRPRSGDPSQARRNIRHHYDLGNDFYRLWLDREMLYTCAYYPSAEATLEEAQTAKMEHICRKLQLRAGERVVEAGCGWGALALYMARHYGVRVRAYNISPSQLALARERADREGLADRVEFVEGDYREIDGRYDVLASIGMLEHVGPKHIPDFGRVIHRCLGDNGRGLVHSIVSDLPGPMNTWIERHIFPGARPPTPEQMMTLFSPFGFSVHDVENLRLHYARTLAHWLERFEAARDQVLASHGPSFVRGWRFYLASSQAAFSSGQLQLYQVLFSRRGSNLLAQTRAHLYRGEQ